MIQREPSQVAASVTRSHTSQNSSAATQDPSATPPAVTHDPIPNQTPQGPPPAPLPYPVLITPELVQLITAIVHTVLQELGVLPNTPPAHTQAAPEADVPQTGMAGVTTMDMINGTQPIITNLPHPVMTSEVPPVLTNVSQSVTTNIAHPVMTSVVPPLMIDVAQPVTTDLPDPVIGKAQPVMTEVAQPVINIQSVMSSTELTEAVPAMEADAGCPEVTAGTANVVGQPVVLCTSPAGASPPTATAVKPQSTTVTADLCSSAPQVTQYRDQRQYIVEGWSDEPPEGDVPATPSRRRSQRAMSLPRVPYNVPAGHQRTTSHLHW